MTNHPERVALITGGNRGIGFATARKLAAKRYRVFLASRNQQASAQTIERIHAMLPDACLEALPLDLASLASVRKCAAAFHAKGYPLHLLINNAGLMVTNKTAQFTADGFELTFGTNHLGHFLLTHLLLDDLKQTAPSRVITVSSRLHIPGVGHGPPPDFDFDNLKAEKYYDPEVFYKNSKLANMWFTYELHRRLAGTGVTSNAVCPGFVPEAIADHMPTRWDHFKFKYVLPRMPFARSVEQASAAYLYVATDPSFDSISGKFFMDGKEQPSSDESYDEHKARSLWDLSRTWCGIPPLSN